MKNTPKRKGPLDIALLLCVFLPVLLVKGCTLLFSFDKMKNKNHITHAVSGWGTGNILFFFLFALPHSFCFHIKKLYTLSSVLQMPRLPTQLGYFKIACRGSKNCWAGGLQLGNFSSFYPRQLFFQICQFPVNSESFLGLFNVQDHFFHQFQGLRRPGEQSISIIHFTQKSTI